MPVQLILIVDDEPNQRFMLEQALRSPECWTIATAASGQEALERVVEQPPDLIITDYNMVSMNGLEFISELRAHGVDSRVILMTAYSSPELFEAAQQLHVDHYLTKPVPIKLLRCVTASVLEDASAAEFDC